MAVEEVLDTGEEVMASAATVDAVIAIGIELLFELDAGLDELFAEFDCILEVHVVVGKAVADQEVAVQSLETVER